MTGWTGVGPVGFTDTMVITAVGPAQALHGHAIPGRSSEAPASSRSCLRGDRTEFRWTERILLPEAVLALVPHALRPGLTRLAYAVIAPVRAGRSSVTR